MKKPKSAIARIVRAVIDNARDAVDLEDGGNVTLLRVPVVEVCRAAETDVMTLINGWPKLHTSLQKKGWSKVLLGEDIVFVKDSFWSGWSSTHLNHANRLGIMEQLEKDALRDSSYDSVDDAYVPERQEDSDDEDDWDDSDEDSSIIRAQKIRMALHQIRERGCNAGIVPPSGVQIKRSREYSVPATIVRNCKIFVRDLDKVDGRELSNLNRLGKRHGVEILGWNSENERMTLQDAMDASGLFKKRVPSRTKIRVCSNDAEELHTREMKGRCDDAVKILDQRGFHSRRVPINSPAKYRVEVDTDNLSGGYIEELRKLAGEIRETLKVEVRLVGSVDDTDF